MWTRVRARVCLGGGSVCGVVDPRRQGREEVGLPDTHPRRPGRPGPRRAGRAAHLPYVRARVRVRACACVRARACVRACVHSILNRPLLGAFVLQTVKDVFGNEVRGLHSTYNNQIKEQVPAPAPAPAQRACTAQCCAMRAAVAFGRPGPVCSPDTVSDSDAHLCHTVARGEGAGGGSGGAVEQGHGREEEIQGPVRRRLLAGQAQGQGLGLRARRRAAAAAAAAAAAGSARAEWFPGRTAWRAQAPTSRPPVHTHCKRNRRGEGVRRRGVGRALHRGS